MFRPRGNAGQANPPETSISQGTHQPMFHSARNDEQLNTPAASTSRVTGQSMFRPVRTVEPATTPVVPISRLAHQGLPQPVSQPTSDGVQNHTPTVQSFHRPPRFLSSSRGNAEPANASTTSTSRVTRPVTRIIDSIESDTTPPPPASRNIQKPMLQSGRSSIAVPTNPPAAAPSTSRTSRRPFLQQLRNTGPDSIEPANAPSPSTTRGPNPLLLPDRIPNGSITTPATSASHVISQPAPQPVSNAGHNRNPPTSATRMPQQPTVQSTRHAIPAHTPTAAASRMAQQPTMQPTRTLPVQNPSASSSRTSQQPTFRPVRTTAAPTNTPVPSAPASSSSATILEFICLYTHDLRRKKKRWQDGKLKFHTFNKKYMVYDDGGSFVGDGHWQGDEGEFTEGLELNLDRGMAIVQVMECTGSKEQDLGEVLGKRVREVEERRINAATKNPASTASLSNPAKRSRGIAMVLQGHAPTAAATTTTNTTTTIPPPKNGGAWSKHAVDLLGMTRPSR